MRHLKTAVSAILIALLVIVAVDYTASAATGRPFLLGKLNKANKQTVLKRTTPGTALKVLTSSPGNAPFAVNGTGTVTNLSADKVDGLDSSVLGTRSYAWRVPVVNQTSVQYVLPVPNGSYLVSYSNLFTGLAADKQAECWVEEQGTTNRYTAYTRGGPSGTGTWVPALSGAGLVTKTPANQILVGCNTSGGGSFSTYADTPLEIVATPTNPIAAPALIPYS